MKLSWWNHSLTESAVRQKEVHINKKEGPREINSSLQLPQLQPLPQNHQIPSPIIYIYKNAPSKPCKSSSIHSIQVRFISFNTPAPSSTSFHLQILNKYAISPPNMPFQPQICHFSPKYALFSHSLSKITDTYTGPIFRLPCKSLSKSNYFLKSSPK